MSQRPKCSCMATRRRPSQRPKWKPSSTCAYPQRSSSRGPSAKRTTAGMTGGFRQIEGDIAGEGGPVTGRADLDLGVTLDGHGVQAVTLVPERAWLRAGGKDVWFGGGILVGPWRVEPVDPWDQVLADR